MELRSGWEMGFGGRGEGEGRARGSLGRTWPFGIVVGPQVAYVLWRLDRRVKGKTLHRSSGLEMTACTAASIE